MALLSNFNQITAPSAIATPFMQFPDTAQSWVAGGSALVSTISTPTSNIPLFPYRTQAIQITGFGFTDFGEVSVALPQAAIGPVTVSFYARGDGIASWVIGMYLSGSGVSTITVTPPTTGKFYQVALNLPAANTYTFRVLRNGAGPSVIQINGLSIASQNYSAGRTDGLAVPAGMIGERVDFTARTVTCTNAGQWYSNATPLATLTPGVWLIFGAMNTPLATATVDVVFSTVSTNSAADGTGSVSPSITGTFSVATTTLGNEQVVAHLPGYLSVSVNTPVYAKGFCEDRAGQVITVRGFAARIA